MYKVIKQIYFTIGQKYLEETSVNQKCYWATYLKEDSSAGLLHVILQLLN